MKTSSATIRRESLVFAFVAVGLVGACSSNNNGGRGTGGRGGVDAGRDGSGGAAGSTSGDASVGGDGAPDATADAAPDVEADAGADVAADADEGTDAAVDVPAVADAGPGDSALSPDAAAITCPTTISGSLDTADGTQIGRHSRIVPVSACGMTKAFPQTGPDSTNPHIYDVYRFVNPTAAAVCFAFTLTYGEIAVADGGSDVAPGSDGGVDTALGEAGDGAVDAEIGDATTGAEGGDNETSADAGEDGDATSFDAAPEAGPVVVAPAKYLTAYSTFYPATLATGYLGDVGDKLTSPQTMGITVPAGGTIDVIVYGIDPAPGGVGPYTLSCATQ
jgi:hypothetical protein